VLVQFSVAWDDDAVILGAVRHGPLVPACNAKKVSVRSMAVGGGRVQSRTAGKAAAEAARNKILAKFCCPGIIG
jgi:hypothetical protein